MQDIYDLETNLKGTGSVIIIANDQLRDTSAYLLLLKIVSVVARGVSKTGCHNFKNSPFILAMLFLHFTALVFLDIYVRENK